MSEPVLEVRDLRVAFHDRDGADQEVVHGVDLDVPAGRVVALVGESGSGKSVSALSVLRLLPAEARVTGAIRVRTATGDQVDVATADAAALRQLRGAAVGVVFQEPMAAWDPVYPIGRQIAEALEAHDRESGDQAVAALLRRSGLDDPDRIARSFPHQLSGGQLQRAMIAMATSCKPALLIADEPTTALDVTVQAGILDLLRSFAAAGTAVLLITHDMGVVADLADDIIVLRDGSVVERGPVEQVLLHPEADYTRDLLASVPSLATSAGSSSSPSPATGVDGAPASGASLRGVSVTYRARRRRAGARSVLRAVDDVTLDLPAGRTLGLVGESGSGKSTLARCLTGLLRPDDGSVRVGDVDLAGLRGSRLRAAQREVGIVFQDPGSSLNPRHTVARSVAEPLRLAGWSGDRSTARVDDVLSSVGLGPEHAVRFPHQLSGGQRQRVAIARALALQPRVLVADEPTSALDVSVQARILALIRDLQQQYGFACLFVSHDLAVVAAVAHEVAVMHDGRVVEYGATAEVLTHPRAEYTVQLLEAAPVADPREQRRRRERREQHLGSLA
ncbi:dipeptide ABC transporter ATP-binding protein [uncultured Jatrophihabitans sp.]|uniref:dipeptide ABC transporter ATP-binding protein n=1 Tax=uncultured Jatrophihabitans sp. TaxID=1610747 RepID=UPI0035CC0D2C